MRTFVYCIFDEGFMFGYCKTVSQLMQLCTNIRYVHFTKIGVVATVISVILSVKSINSPCGSFPCHLPPPPDR